jgi:hypothetical protein
MNDWNRLLLTLDKTIGFPTKIRSSVKKRWQGYDQWKNEHVIWLEYRIKVNPGTQPPPKPAQYLHDLHRNPTAAPVKQVAPMATIRELMDVRFVNKVDSSPSLPSTKNSKSTTKRAAVRPKKIRPKPPASPIKPAGNVAPRTIFNSYGRR